MHIIHLIPEVNKGGVENIVCSLNKNINSLGYKSTVISSGGLYLLSAIGTITRLNLILNQKIFLI